MKKIFALAAIALFMVSCSDDDSNSTNQENAVLVKKMIDSSEDGVLTTVLTYDGNKITTSVTDDGSSTEYTYANGLLVKQESFYNDTTFEKTTYQYNSNNKLESSVVFYYSVDADPYAVKSVYTYNSDTSISAALYEGNENSQTEFYGTRTITLSNGNITKYSTLEEGATQPIEYTMTYDAKNNPNKNVFANDVMVLASLTGGNNNTLTESSNMLGSFTTTYEYTYNNNNYPTKLIMNEGGFISNIEYFY